MEHILNEQNLFTAEQVERPLQNEQIAEIAEYWTQRRPDMPARPVDREITVIDDQTIINFHNGRPLVLKPGEINAFNYLLPLKGKSMFARLLKEIPSPDGGSMLSDALELEAYGLVKIRRSRVESNLPRHRIELHPHLVINDVRGNFLDLNDGEIRHNLHLWCDGDLAREQLHKHGFTLLNDTLIGYSGYGPKLRQYLSGIFESDIVRIHEGDHPPDRERARDVARVAFQGNLESPTFPMIELNSHHTTAITNRHKSNIAHRPPYSRLEITKDPILHPFVKRLITFLPPEALTEKTTIGINFFRTHTNVVERPHQDEEKYVMIYVVDKIGSGARTQLYKKNQYGTFEDRPFFSRSLAPGEILIFKDEDYLHDVTPLVPTADGRSQRDAIIMTFNHPTTYSW